MVLEPSLNSCFASVANKSASIAAVAVTKVKSGPSSCVRNSARSAGVDPFEDLRVRTAAAAARSCEQIIWIKVWALHIPSTAPLEGSMITAAVLASHRRSVTAVRRVELIAPPGRFELDQ